MSIDVYYKKQGPTQSPKASKFLEDIKLLYVSGTL